MTETRIRAILAAYGADPAHWPASERAAAQSALAVDAGGLAEALAEAREIDMALAADARAAPADETLVARVLAQAPGANIVAFPARRAPAWRAVAALAACALVGVFAGFSSSIDRDDGFTADVDAAFGAAFDIDHGADG